MVITFYHCMDRQEGKEHKIVNTQLSLPVYFLLAISNISVSKGTQYKKNVSLLTLLYFIAVS